MAHRGVSIIKPKAPHKRKRANGIFLKKSPFSGNKSTSVVPATPHKTGPAATAPSSNWKKLQALRLNSNHIHLPCNLSTDNRNVGTEAEAEAEAEIKTKTMDDENKICEDDGNGETFLARTHPERKQVSRSDQRKRKADDDDIVSATKKTKTSTTATKSTAADTAPKDLWFDDVNQEDIAREYGILTNENAKLLKSMDLNKGSKAKWASFLYLYFSFRVTSPRLLIGRFVAIDCEMVGVGPNGDQSALARVSIVNFHGATLLDQYVRPMERVTDYRTAISGITRELIIDAPLFHDVQKQVADLLKDRILVGHALTHDLKALLLDHPRRDVRDTSRYKPFRNMVKGKTPALRRLAKDVLGLTIQEGAHSSVEDARVTMMLYRKVKEEWDKSLGPRARTDKLAKRKKPSGAMMVASEKAGEGKRKEEGKRKGKGKGKAARFKEDEGGKEESSGKKENSEEEGNEGEGD
ncbi:ribonuclease H-like domain-containing protein [Jimgerdemannia flammicorona]|uniref:RNA exonuclease 4 n=1 Tax=Jimgerdemannia flammicorona TaxID=994334 RepID=A0A433BA02_9FUNG|nr:ribonuclease H-like domain-containing protein [Jimgerdemannia flammicorona]